MAERLRRRVRTAVVWELLAVALAERMAATGTTALDVVDVGGGTGGFAVPLAEEGHRVTVVDPNPDALAALTRRAAEAGVSDRVDARQGEAAAVVELLGTGCADVAVCHGVLEVVDDPVEALRGIAAIVRHSGVASVLVAGRFAAVLARAVAGHLEDARHALGDPDGRWGSTDPLPRRFDEQSLTRAFEAAGLRVQQVHGVRVFSDLVPGSVVDDPAGTRALLELEAAAADHPAFRAVAAQLHVLAARP
ncbi:MAG: methyltransferase domain-containing protein [Jiangellaceae bacterium]